MRTIRIVAAIVLIAGGSLALQVAQSQQPGIKRTDLQQQDLSIPGREVVQVRVDIAPGVTSVKHNHPGEEIVYVIEGSLEYQVEGKPPVTLEAGEVLFIPARAMHSAKNVGSGNAAELATYIVEKGKPLFVPAAAASLPAKPAVASEDARIRPFRVNIQQAALDDLRMRLFATRWPDKETVPDRSQGAQLAEMHCD